MSSMTFSNIANIYVHRNYDFLLEFMEIQQLLDS